MPSKGSTFAAFSDRPLGGIYLIRMEEDNDEILKTKRILGEFDIIHHELLRDLLSLISITMKHRDKPDEYNSMFRSIVRGFFSLIEADLYYLNVLDTYTNYIDRKYFYIKLKKTFKQVAKTLEREAIQKKYFDDIFNF